MWQTIELTLENTVCFWANLRCSKWPNIEQTFYASGPTESNAFIFTNSRLRGGFLLRRQMTKFEYKIKIKNGEADHRTDHRERVM